MAYDEWESKLLKLNDHINSLTVWDNYAEKCQAGYDWLLKQNKETKCLNR